jgi:hypothetical protein
VYSERGFSSRFWLRAENESVSGQAKNRHPCPTKSLCDVTKMAYPPDATFEHVLCAKRAGVAHDLKIKVNTPNSGDRSKFANLVSKIMQYLISV